MLFVMLKVFLYKRPKLVLLDKSNECDCALMKSIEIQQKTNDIHRLYRSSVAL